MICRECGSYDYFVEYIPIWSAVHQSAAHYPDFIVKRPHPPRRGAYRPGPSPKSSETAIPSEYERSTQLTSRPLVWLLANSGSWQGAFEWDVAVNILVGLHPTVSTEL